MGDIGISLYYNIPKAIVYLLQGDYVYAFITYKGKYRMNVGRFAT